MASTEGALKDVEVDRLVIDWLKKRKQVYLTGFYPTFSASNL